MCRIFLLALLLATPQEHLQSAGRTQRTLSGAVYFSNNTPRNLDTFPVELYSRNQRRRLASVRTDAHGHFKLTGIRPGKFLLKFTWPPHRCTLWYRVDVATQSSNRIRVIMDAACAHHNGTIQDLSDN